jgi:hypothetical protein
MPIAYLFIDEAFLASGLDRPVLDICLHLPATPLGLSRVAIRCRMSITAATHVGGSQPEPCPGQRPPLPSSFDLFRLTARDSTVIRTGHSAVSTVDGLPNF